MDLRTAGASVQGTVSWDDVVGGIALCTGEAMGVIRLGSRCGMLRASSEPREVVWMSPPQLVESLQISALPYGEDVFWAFRHSRPVLALVGLFGVLEPLVAVSGDKVAAQMAYEARLALSFAASAGLPFVVSLARDLDYLLVAATNRSILPPA